MPATLRDGSCWWMRLALVGLLVAQALGSSLILVEHREPLTGDPVSAFISATALRRAVSDRTVESFRLWMDFTGLRMPLPAVAWLPAQLLGEDRVAAMRLTETAAFLLVLLLLFRLGSRLASPGAGLLSAYLFAVFPTVQAWSRAGNGDPFLWLGLLGLFRLLVDLEPRSLRKAAILGLVVGLCLLTRLLSLPYLVGVLLFGLLTAPPRARALPGWLLGGACTAVVAGGYYLAISPGLLSGLSASTGGRAWSLGWSPLVYLRAGFWLPTLVVLFALLLLWQQRLLSPRLRGLFLTWLVVPAAQFLLLWDSWDRYLVPLLGPAYLLAALTLDLATRDRPRVRRLGFASLALLGTLPLGLALASPEAAGGGLLLPNREVHDGLARALATLPPGVPVGVENEVDDPFYVLALHHARGKSHHPLINLNPRLFLDSGDPPAEVRFVLRACWEHRSHQDPQSVAEVKLREWDARSLAAGRTLLGTTRDPNGAIFQIFRLYRALRLP